MCRGDVSLGTYTYLSGGGNDVTARSWGSHQCIDFDDSTTFKNECTTPVMRREWRSLSNPEKDAYTDAV
jgi:hypothetical protein